MTSPETSVSEAEVWAAAAAIAREGFPKGREGASDYRRRLARAALTAAAQVRAQAEAVAAVESPEAAFNYGRRHAYDEHVRRIRKGE